MEVSAAMGERGYDGSSWYPARNTRSQYCALCFYIYSLFHAVLFCLAGNCRPADMQVEEYGSEKEENLIRSSNQTIFRQVFSLSHFLHRVHLNRCYRKEARAL